MNNKSVFITGVTSMDSSHLIEYLLPLGLKIYGLKRRSSTDTTWRIRHLLNDIEIVNGDMCDSSSLNKAIQLIKPNFVFSLAAQSFVKASWDAPESTFDVNAMGVIRLLESIRSFGKKDTRVYQASSSEMFGKVQETPQTELTKFYPRSVYGCSKCLSRDSKIYTDKGLKRIKDIKIGDLVWTHTGQLKPVINIFKRKDYKERIKIVAISSNGKKGIQSNFQATMTPEHPILTERGWIEARNLTNIDKIAIVATNCKICNKKIPANRIFCSKKCASGNTWRNPIPREKIASFVSSLGSLEYIFVPIHKIKKYSLRKNLKVDYNVFNIEVADDNSYVANGIVMHNCAAHYICVNYRESYDMFISCGISFNHESFRRGLEFVSRKISYGVAKIHCKLANTLELGNLDSKRDFGYAPEFVEAFWRILQLPKPDDFVLATGETHSIREFVKTAFEAVEIYNWQDYVKQNSLYMRPAEVDLLLGDSRKARQAIDWQPKTSFQELVKIMVEADVTRISRGDKFE